MTSLKDTMGYVLKSQEGTARRDVGCGGSIKQHDRDPYVQPFSNLQQEQKQQEESALHSRRVYV